MHNFLISPDLFMVPELPSTELALLRRAASGSADGSTVALVFGTIDFAELLLNWACFAATKAHIDWFTIVAMDTQLYSTLRRTFVRDRLLLMPRARQANITKLEVIGERQRFGLQVLASGLSVVHSDADALWLKNPSPLLQSADVVAERIWGKPLSVVRAWGAAICTGFYYARSTPAVIGVAKRVASMVAAKRERQPGWQASDQYYLNVVLHEHGVRWNGGGSVRMAPMEDVNARFYDWNSTEGVVATPSGAIRLRMLPHVLVPRACPVLSERELAQARAGASGTRLRGRAKFWAHLRREAYALHCFPPEEKAAQPGGERRSIFMGHPAHTAAELSFARRQGLWLLSSSWRDAAPQRKKRRAGVRLEAASVCTATETLPM